MALLMESAATSRSLRRLRTLLEELECCCWLNACRTSPPSPDSVSPGVLGVLLARGGGRGGEWAVRDRGLLLGVDLGEP